MDDFFLLAFRQLPTKGNFVPLTKAPSTTTGRAVHGFKDGVAVHGRLLAVVYGFCRGEFLSNEVLGVLFYYVRALFIEVCPLFFG